MCSMMELNNSCDKCGLPKLNPDSEDHISGLALDWLLYMKRSPKPDNAYPPAKLDPQFHLWRFRWHCALIRNNLRAMFVSVGRALRELALFVKKNSTVRQQRACFCRAAPQ